MNQTFSAQVTVPTNTNSGCCGTIAAMLVVFFSRENKSKNSSFDARCSGLILSRPVFQNSSGAIKRRRAFEIYYGGVNVFETVCATIYQANAALFMSPESVQWEHVNDGLCAGLCVWRGGQG